MKIRNKSTNKNYLIPGVLFMLSIATVFGVGIYTTNTTNALSYSTSEDVSFTFKPTLSIGLSTDSLTIDNLVPGTTSDSNTVTVTVSSNTPYGYVLSAGVGSTVSTDPYYNTSDLVHDNSTTQVPTTNKFSSIATSASLPTLDTDNTWGYSTSTDGGTSWSTYSGLSHAETKPLLDISDPAQHSTIDFKIAARSASTQASGTYNNVITFYAVGKPEPHYLYDEVAKMSKGTQTAEDLLATIYKSNSGVYEYNDSVFGKSSDTSDSHKIYYYRGIIDNSFVSDDGNGIGSSGDGVLYPNYVKFANDICWRIVRTTGSGGIKMIYNGIWDNSNGTCANAGEKAQIDKSSYSPASVPTHQIVRVGYTFDNRYASNTNAWVPVSTLFGSNSINNNITSSEVKIKTENWYANNLSSYTAILEGSAGYCGDRTVYNDSKILQPETAKITQNGCSGEENFFGPYVRNTDSIQPPTLTCAKASDGTTIIDRSQVDLYSVSGSSTGNGELTYPVALLTADEASFAGSGSMMNTRGSRYKPTAFLRSGQSFLLLSPYSQKKASPYSSPTVFALSQYGAINLEYTSSYVGLRPVISLKSGTEYTSGSGTATDPWVVPAP